MKNDEPVISNIPEIKSASSLSSPRDQTFNTTSEGRVSSFNSNSSSSSSPSDLRRRLEDLPSPNEFTLLADRVATLGRRISRKRELFLRLHGVANRIEENDEWEEREQRAESEGSSGALRPRDARARRRARVRLETSSNGDKAMVVSQTGDPTGPSKTTDSDDKSNSAEATVERSREHDYLQSSTIEISRRQPRPISLSEPSSTRSAQHNNVAWHDTKTATTNLHSFRNFTSRDSTSRSLDLPSVAPFSLNNVRPKKFGGYRPSSSMILKNLSSGSESEFANETNSRGQSRVRKLDTAIATLELSSPESTAAVGPIKKMPIMSARSDVTGSVLPNLLSSTLPLQDNNIGHSISQEAWQAVCLAGQPNRANESSIRFSSQVEGITPDVSGEAFYDKQAGCDEFPTRISDDSWNVAAKYECDEKEEMSENPISFSARSFVSDSAEFATIAYNEQANRDLLNNYDRFQQVRAQFQDKRNEQEKLEDYNNVIVPNVCHDETQNGYSFNHSTDQANVEVNFSENSDGLIFDAQWDQMTNFYTSETIDTAGLIGRTGVTEDALSSEASEAFESEDHSRSSYMACKMYLQKGALSNGRSKREDIDTSDKYDQENVTVTNVPTLALNSQDISYSTSAGSRECSAVRLLDPHALIKALSDESLKQEKQESASRRRDDLYQLDNGTSAVSRVPDFPGKGETWRVPRSSTTSESSKKSLTRVPSKIPIRISSSKNMSFTNINKLSGSCKNLENSMQFANEEEGQFTDENGAQDEASNNIVHQRLVLDSSYPDARKQYSSSHGSRNESIEAAIAKAHSSRFPSDGGIAEYGDNGYKPERFISSSLQSPRTPFGDEIRDKVGMHFNSKFHGNCSPVLFNNEASFSNNRDYAKIDDDVRSKSDRSTSRKSIETADITSATGSPYLPKCRRDTNPARNGSTRNVEANATWRTEDECASINNEEYSENTKNKDYYDSYGDKTGATYLRKKEQFESGIEEVYDWSPSRSQLPRIDLSLEIEKIVRKQSRANNGPNLDNDAPDLHRNLELTDVTEVENLTSQVRRKQEICSFAAKMSSSTLSCEPKRKRKSQERFPFTISEASGVLSSEHVDTSDRQTDKRFDGHSDRPKMDGPFLKKKTVHQLKTHPSITRLASSGLEDTVAEILCCVAQEQQENESSSKSRMRALVRIFSSKLRRISKQRSDNRTAEPAKIIYENRACQVDSKTNSSSSSDSLAEKTRRLSYDGSSSNRWIDQASPDCTTVTPENILKKTESLEMITREHPRRKYDRDNLWVQDVKDSLYDEQKDEIILEEDKEDDAKERPEDQYSIFLAEEFRLSKSDDNDNSRKEEQDGASTSCHPIPADGKDKCNVGRKTWRNIAPEEEVLEEDSTGCFCLRLCRLFGHRLPVREQVSSSRVKKPSFLLRRRKK